jgi:hypothetical protein
MYIRGVWTDLQVGDVWCGGSDDMKVTAIESYPADDVFVLPTQRVTGQINGKGKIYRWTFPADMVVEIQR